MGGKKTNEDKRKKETERKSSKRTERGEKTEKGEKAEKGDKGETTTKTQVPTPVAPAAHPGVTYRGEGSLPLPAWVEKVTTGGASMLTQEFVALRKEALAKFKPPQWTSEAFKANPLKNRYQDVDCWDQTRVKLTPTGPRSKDYIHANFVDGVFKPRQFICTQGPIEDVPGLFEDTQTDFWQMVWEQQVTMIVMLCSVVEAGKAKCAQYWPEKEGERMDFGPARIECKEKTERDYASIHIRVTTLEVLMDGYTNPRRITHFLNDNWPDRKIPPSAWGVIQLIIATHSAQKSACQENGIPRDDSPTVVHCSAGIGRTGTFIAIDLALNLIHAFDALDLAELVRSLRSQRPFAIQTPVQYAFLYQAILEYVVDKRNITADRTKFAKDIARIK